jgi:tRNA threonylcarbamoyladenosine biosynthesis protein TsaB
MILAIDTCQDQCALALFDGYKTFEVQEVVKTGQAERLFPLLTQLLEKSKYSLSDVTEIGVTVGPGNFTGIRIGLCAALGLGTSLGVPVFGVTTLAAWAQTAQLLDRRGRIRVILDARKNQQYHQTFNLRAGKVQALTAPDVEPQTPDSDAIGSFSQDLAIAALSAKAICRLVADKNTVPAEPFYIRAPDAVPAA